jgi:two-component system, LytTR family, response regulator
LHSTAIIDDDPTCRLIVKNLLTTFFPDIKLVGEADDVRPGIEMLAKTRPDIVFLDVQMPGGSGFDLLKELGEYDYRIIFTTTFDKYAIDAFRISAIDYLLKPVDPEEFQRAVNKALEKEEESDFKLASLLHNLSLLNAQEMKFALSTNEGTEFVALKNILYCRAQQNYTEFVLSGGRSTMMSRTLGEFEQILEEKGFFRIHQSHLINLNHIKRIQRGKVGAVVMDDDAVLEISRRKKDDLKKVLEKLFY